LGVQDGLYDGLPSRPLPDQLGPWGHLAAHRLGARVRHPDLGQEAAGGELGQHGCTDRVGVDLGVGDHADLLGVGDHDPADMQGEHLDDGRGIARRLDHDVMVVGQRRAGERLQPIAPACRPGPAG
jgi:hypothetical protein